MAKKLNIELGFTANTSQAKKEVESLINQLQKIQTTPSSLFNEKDIQSASKAAQQLQQHIRSAVNTDTGKLDLTKFAASLNKSNTNLEYFRKELTKAGNEGKTAFSTLSKAIGEADAPIFKLNGRLGEFVTTLKNSARWQISSDILHGFQSALNSAVSYAKELDESLNNIRIVTGKGTEDMANFAKQANEAAKALGTTTTNYTDASLIYYQQGLSDEEVKKRTDITVKLGNVAKESAEEVSQYMTAIWENYADGSESLQSYADKITALGAATASSSKEIANGLEKFVAVGNQIGLSYDYATAALTTILAKTRQSEDVVGTALKTIFARIQGFNLGETADDGVTLNKYSSALKAVGVDVLDATGEMKDMDTILDDLASKWDTLGAAQKNALAQTVAGVRQYTQLVSLMDNWDFFKENLNTIDDSNGALDQQQEIYLESWEAARKKVKASWEGLYDELIDEQSITKLDNALAAVLDTVGGLVDGFGGLYGILTTVSGFIIAKYSKEIPGIFSDLLATINLITGKTQSQATQLLKDTAVQQREIAGKELGESGLPLTDNISYTAELQGTAKITELKAQLAEQSGKMTAKEKEEAQELIELTAARYKDIQAIGEQIDKRKEQLSQRAKAITKESSTAKVSPDGLSDAEYQAQVSKANRVASAQTSAMLANSFDVGQLKAIQKAMIELQSAGDKTFSGSSEDAKKFGESLTSVNALLAQLEIEWEKITPGAEESMSKLKTAITEYNTALDEGKTDIDEYKEKVIDALNQMAGTTTEEASILNNTISSTEQKVQELITQLVESGNTEAAEKLEKIAKEYEKVGKSAAGAADQISRMNNTNIGPTKLSITEAIGSLTGSTLQAVSAANSLNNAWSTFTDSSATTSQKITSVVGALMNAGFAVSTLISMFGKLKAAAGVLTAGAAGVAVAAVAALAFVVTRIDTARQEAIDNAKEVIEEQNKIIESTEEETSKVKELADAYESAKKAKAENPDSADAGSNLIDSTRSLVEELNNQIDALKESHSATDTSIQSMQKLSAENIIATGSYDDLEKSIREVTKARYEDEAAAAKTSIDSAETALSKSMTKGRGNTLFSEGYHAGYGVTGSLDKNMKDALDKADSSRVSVNGNYETDLNGKQYFNVNGLDINSDDTAEDMVKTYEEVYNAVTEAKKKAQEAGQEAVDALNNDDTFKSLSEWLAKSKEEYDSYTDATEKYNNAIANSKMQDTLIRYSADNVDSIKAYGYAVDDLAERLAKAKLGFDDGASLNQDQLSQVKEEAENQKELAENTLEASGAFDEFATNYKNAQDAIAKANKSRDEGGYGWDDSDVDLNEYYNNLTSDEERKIFAEVDFDQVKSKDNLDAQINYLQEEANAEKGINITSTVDQAISALNSSKSDKMDTIQSLFDWGENGLKTFEEFSKMTEQEQMATLISMGRSLSQTTDDQIAEQKAKLKDTLKVFEDERDDLNDRITSIKNKVAGQKVELLSASDQRELEELETQLNNLDDSIAQKEEKIKNLGKDANFDPSYEVNEDYLDKLSDADKLYTLMTTTEQLSDELKESLGQMIVTFEGLTVDEKFSMLSEALQQDKLDADSLSDALKTMADNGELTVEKLRNFMNINGEDGTTPLKDAAENVQVYLDSLVELAKQYDNCQEALDRYNQALASGNQAMQQEAADNLDLAVRIGEDAKTYGIDADRISILAEEYMDYANSLEAVQNGQSDGAEIAEDMARAEIRLNDAIDDLFNNWDDYEKVMDVCNGTSEDAIALAKKEIATNKTLSASYANLKEDIAGMLDTTSDLLGDDWIVSNMNDVKAAAEGDEQALIRLRESAVTEILINSNLDDLGYDVDVLAQKINDIPDGEINLETDTFVQELVWAMQQAGLAQEEIESRLSGMGISVDLEPMYDELGEAISVSQAIGENAGKALSDAYAATAGVDTEIESQTQTDKDNKTVTGFTSRLEPVTAQGEISVPMIDEAGRQYGQTRMNLPYTVYSQVTDPTYVEAEDTKETTATALKVKSASKQSGGNISVANRPGGTNRQPREARTRTTRSPRSSSGGSRSTPRAKSYRPSREVNVADTYHDEKKKLKDEKERYHVINNQLEDITHNLNDIAQLKDRAFGKNRLNALKAENKELQAQAKAQAKLVKETEKYLKSDATAVKALGAVIGSDGTITNYDTLMSNKVKEYNSSVLTYAKMLKASEDEYNRAMQDATNRYNASGRTDADSAIYDAAAERAKEVKDEADKAAERYKKQYEESYKDFVETLNQYEETYDKMREERLKEQQIQDQIYDNELETIQYEIEIKVDVDEDTLKFLQEIFDQLGDSADKAVDRIANLQKQMKAYNDEAKTYEKGISDILKHAGADQDTINNFINGKMDANDVKKLGGLGLTTGDVEALRDYSDKLIALNKSYRDLRDTMVEQVSNAFDEYIEQLQTATDKIEKLQNVTETYKNIIDVVGKKLLDPTGSVTKALDRAAFNQARNLTAASKQTLEFSESALKKAQKTRDDLAKLYGDDNETVLKWDEQIKELSSQRDEAYADWLSNWQAECEAARTIFEDTLDSIVTNFETKVSGLAGSLDMLNDAYERQSKVDEVYVDDYEKIYQLSKLSREISKSIDDTSQVKNKEKLKKLQNEINKAQEQGVKLSQYDLDYLEKKYQLELARQQLEEAKNAKSKVTMRRDSEGNYGYVYTADANAVADAEQNYEDKLHDLQELNSEYIKTLQGDIIQIQQDLENDLKDFAENFKGTQEEYEKGVAEITEKYKTLMEYKQQQMTNVLNNNRELYLSDWKSYSEATGYKLSADEDYLDKWEETNYAIITGYDTLEEAMSNWKDAVNTVTSEAIQAYKDWYSDTDTALKDGGTSMDEFGQKATETAETVTDQTNKIAESAEEMAQTFKTSFDGILDSAKSFSKQFEDVIMGIIDSNTKLADSIRKVLAEASKAESSTNSGTNGSYSGGTSDGIFSDGTRSSNSNSNSSRTSTTSRKSGQDNGPFTDGRGSSSRRRTTKLDDKTRYGVALAIIEGTYGWGDDPYRSGKLTEKFGAGNGIQAIVNKLWTEGKVFSGAWEGAYYGLTSSDMPRYAYNRFNTGGYTGNWIGNYGKLALLDSKEIVLNKDDTSNFLQAINVVRDIAKTIDLNASNANNSFAKLFAAAGVKTAETKLEQEVHITAEFPNATDKNEILEAFDNVVNLAAQYVNRK